MKKISLIVCALATTVASFAGLNDKLVKRNAVETKINPNIRIVETQSAILPEENVNALTQRLATVVTDTMILPYIAPGTYNSGTPSSGITKVNEAFILAPYQDSLTFYNYSGLTSSWYVDGDLKATDSLLKVNLVGMGETQSLPLMKTPTRPTSDTTQTAFVDYQFGAYYTEVYSQHGFQNYIEVAPAYLESLTKCAMYTEQRTNSKGKDTYGSDWTFVTATGSGVGDYWYGTQMVHPSLGVRFDTIFIPYFQEGAMYIDHISAGVFTAGTGGVDGIFPAETDHVRATIYPILSGGRIDFSSPIATAIADADDYVGASNASSFYGLLNFYFTEIDPITGAETQVPAKVSGDFVVAFDQFNDGTANFGFITDYYTLIEGDTYLIGGGRFTQLWKTPGNLLVNLYALLPVFEAPESVQFDLAGGTQEFTIPSNVWDDEIEIDAPEWITVEVATDYEEVVDGDKTYYDHKYTNKLTITVAETAASREGVVELDAMGLPVTIIVDQGDVQGIENVRYQNDNKLYNVLGQEVNEDYKGVVIRNGEKFVK